MILPRQLLRKIAAGSLFGRIFRGIFVVSAFSVFLVWGWLNSRFYESLDLEADQRLKQIAAILLTELKESGSDDQATRRVRAIQSFWQIDRAGGMLQNLYWLDLSVEPPVFVASYSALNEKNMQMQPPSAEDVEDLVFDYINELDRGEMVFPDPYAYGVSRRFKILLCPVIDSGGQLSSVIGIEADMEYLNLVVQFRRFLAEGIVVALLLSLLAALVLARNLARKIDTLNLCVKSIETGQQPEPQTLSVVEFDHLYQSFVALARELEIQKSHVQQVFTRKLEELAFTGGAIAHEIRNPLSAIEMHFSLLKRELQKNASESVNSPAIDEINQQLQHLRQLLENFLNYTRKVKANPQKIDLRKFVDHLLVSKQSVIGPFKAEIDISEDLAVSFDPTMLQQILENLINNSCRACAGQELCLSISAVVEYQILRVRFSDNGPGVKAMIRDKLFTPFTTAEAGGSGFGLALVRKLIEAHGGEIDYNDGKNGGAVFTIEVPQHENTGS